MSNLPPRLVCFADKKFYAVDFRSVLITKMEFHAGKINKIYLKKGRQWYAEQGYKYPCWRIVLFLNTAGEKFGVETAQLILHVNDPYMRNPHLITIPRSIEYRITYNSEDKTKLSLEPVSDVKPLWSCDIF